jgi:MoaA/NifB/PqqE/SkfB family radical SAM enzyme
MYLPSIPGVWNVVRRRPRLLWVAASNLSGRLAHSIGRSHAAGYSGPPEQLTIVVTDACNHRCPMCHYAASASPEYQLNRTGHMKPEIFRRIIRETPGRPFVSFTGGEPLLHPHIAEFVEMAHARGLATTLTTNGSLLAKRAAALVDAGLDMLVVSVDGPPETHDHIRGKNAFSRLAEGLRVVLGHAARPVVFVSMALSDQNDDQILPMYDIALRLRVDGINYNHLWMHTREMVTECSALLGPGFQVGAVDWNIQPELVDPGQVAQDLETVKRRSRRTGLLVTETPFLDPSQIRVWYREPSRFVKFRSTRCAWIRLRVWPNGDVRPCREWTVGNLAQDGVASVWNGPRMRDFRRLLARHGTIPICARCCYMAHR